MLQASRICHEMPMARLAAPQWSRWHDPFWHWLGSSVRFHVVISADHSWNGSEIWQLHLLSRTNPGGRWEYLTLEAELKMVDPHALHALTERLVYADRKAGLFGEAGSCLGIATGLLAGRLKVERSM